MGSSMVMMWALPGGVYPVEMQASVVVFPLPADPVKSTGFCVIGKIHHISGNSKFVFVGQ